MRTIELGRLFGLRLTATITALYGAILIFVSLFGLAALVLKFSILTAIIAALIATFLHYFSEYLHQMSHAIAARRTGYPMIGMTFFWVLAFSRYPKDEGDLPARIHIYRAFGGPIGSFLVTIIGGGLTLVAHQAGLDRVVIVLLAYFTLSNLLVFSIGALLPLGFNDGSTIIRYWKDRVER